jgi:outer membrane receptor protein involved in Fe transport
VAARRSYIDGILNAAVPDDADVNLVTAPRYYDFQLLADYRPVPEHDLKLFVFGSDDRLELLFENPADLTPDLRVADASASTSFYRTVIEHSWVPDSTVRNVFKTSAGRNWIFFGAGDQLFLDLNNYVAQIRDTFYWTPNDDLTLMVGVDYLFSKSDVRIKFPQVTKEGEPGGRPDFDTVRFTESNDTTYHSIGGFLEVEARVFDRLLLVPGIRFDYFSRVDETALAPRMAVRLALTDKWTLKGGVGLYHQEPSFDETAETFGNPDLNPESAVHYSAGVEYKPLPHLTLDVTGFYKDLRNLVSRTDATVERGGEIVPQNYDNGGVGRVYGLELLVRHEFANNFTGWIGYTLSRAERRDTGADEWRLFDYDQTHILNVLGTYELPRNWTLGFRWRLVSGNPYTPRVGSVYMVDDASYSPIYGAPNSDRLPPFHQLDIRIDKRWVFENWILSAYLDLQNVYNRANTEGFSYNYDSSEKRPQQGLPILPVLGIKGEF